MPLIPKQEPPYYTSGDEGGATGQYIALLAQAGPAAPIATILKNTLGTTVVWSRTSAGLYVATATGKFPANKVAILITPDTEGIIIVAAPEAPPDSIFISTRSINTAPPPSTVYSDDIMGGYTTIQITVFP